MASAIWLDCSPRSRLWPSARRRRGSGRSVVLRLSSGLVTFEYAFVSVDRITHPQPETRSADVGFRVPPSVYTSTATRPSGREGGRRPLFCVWDRSKTVEAVQSYFVGRTSMLHEASVSWTSYGYDSVLALWASSASTMCEMVDRSR